MESGDSNRSTFATNMNEHSSRSHSMLSIVIESTNTVTGQSLRGKLNLVDLAGSERLSRTDATGDRLKEAQNINKSLSALGDVIASLAKKDKHTPFRNSKLTQVKLESCASLGRSLTGQRRGSQSAGGEISTKVGVDSALRNML